MRLGKGSTQQFTTLRVSYRPVFMEDWYLSRYPDVELSELDPLDHFIAQGEQEGRDPNPYFSTVWFKRQLPNDPGVEVRPLHRFLDTDIRQGLKPHPCIDPIYIANNYPDLQTADQILRALCQGGISSKVCEWFSSEEYKSQYADLASLEFPEAHFLTRGIQEDRRPRPNFKVVTRQSFLKGAERALQPIDSFWWDGIDYVVLRSSPDETVLEQIHGQALLDPRVMSAGVHAISALPQFIATDLEARDLVSIDALIDVSSTRYDFVMLLPSIGLGGAEKYFSQLAYSLQESHGKRVLMLVTDIWQYQADEFRRNLRKKHLARVDVVSLRELTHRTWKVDFVLALLLMAIQPEAVLVANSNEGFQCLSRYGLALSNFTRPIACFFSESPFAIGAPYATRYADTLPAHALVLSDNSTVQDCLKQRLVSGPGCAEFIVLPQYIDRADEHLAHAEMSLRLARWDKPRERRILWLSRWEPFKNTEALRILAKLRSPDIIEAHGPGTESLDTSTLHNLIGRGPVWDPASIDLSLYDCFLFTSQFEGMPNVVLEMAARKIPVLSANVGGLRETFSDTGISYYENASSSRDTAATIDRALDSLFSLSPAELTRRVETASREVYARHSIEAFESELRHLLERVELEPKIE